MKPSLLAVLVSVLALSCPSNPPPHPRATEANLLCANYLAAGDLQTAEDQCDLGIQFSPQFADLWVNKAIIAYKRGQVPRSKELLIKALRLNPEQAQGYNNLGLIYMDEHAFGKAHDNYERALKVNPDYLEARYNLALSYMALRDFEHAKKELRTLIQIKPDLADPWGQLGQMALDEGENENAIEFLTRATQLDPKFTYAWLSLGNSYVEAGRPCDGKDAYSTCIEVDESNVQCRNNIIVAEKKCKLQDKALEDVKGRQAGTKTPETEYAAAIAAKDKGLVNDEERALKRCLKYDPKYVQCHYGLFELYRNRSDEKNATIACKNFMKFASTSEYGTQISTCQQFVRD